MKLVKFLIIVLIFVGIGYTAANFYYSGNLQKTVINQIGKNISLPMASSTSTVVQSQNILDNLLGFYEPKYYLLLFLNNTELRPCGGFIGVYGVVKIDKGIPEIIKTEGSEFLDYNASDAKLPEPPRPLADYLLVKHWYFRDSNWSPDFKTSAQKSLELYKLENGIEADKISGVIGFTPTLAEELLKISGPLTINGEVYDSKNFLEKLQYDVEYGYAEKDLARTERKDILGDLARALIGKIKFDVLLNWSKYLELGKQMIAEKQVMMYSLDSGYQDVLAQQKWSGEMAQNSGDYLMWVDANLGALKTDWIVKRTLNYSIEVDKTGKYLARATMNYEHGGSFDWRTTRYRTYARVFVPAGSKLVKAVGAMKTDRSSAKGTVDSGFENGRQWFGAFISIEPKKKGTLSFEYYLPENVVNSTGTTYALFAQKQLGVTNTDLVLNLNFKRNFSSATPSEISSAKIGDGKYENKIDLSIDRQFEIKF